MPYLSEQLLAMARQEMPRSREIIHNFVRLRAMRVEVDVKTRARRVHYQVDELAE